VGRYVCRLDVRLSIPSSTSRPYMCSTEKKERRKRRKKERKLIKKEENEEGKNKEDDTKRGENG
jgi:hypothetical protein